MTILGEKQHYNMFEPIINTTLSNIKNSGVKESLSGPVQRGDYLTIRKHLVSLRKVKSGYKKLFLQSYISQSLILLEIIKTDRGRLTAGQNRVKKALESELNKL